MRIRHILPETSCRHEEVGDQAFFQRTQSGWISFYGTRQSRYEGWYVTNPRKSESPFLKLLERIEYVRENDTFPQPMGIISSSEGILHEYGDGMKVGFQPHATAPALTISSFRKHTLRFTCDIRGMYESPEMGREYTLTPDNTGVLVCYRDENFTQAYLYFRCDTPATLLKEWKEVTYPRDTARNSPPFNCFVFTALQFDTERVDIGYGLTEATARKASAAAAEQPPFALGVGISHLHISLARQVEIAQQTTRQALDWLQTPQGIWAGLPWFHQVWSRDELIAALGFRQEEQILCITRYLQYPLEKGELPTFIGSGTTCADGVGWLALLIREYGILTLPEETRKSAKTFFEKAVAQLKEHHAAHHGLIYSGHNATWMDTIGREGFRLEIQTMYALCLEILAELTQETEYERERMRVLSSIRSLLFQGGYLHDGLGDPRKRPNVFLAYLLQPDLLTEQEWRSCFDQVLAVTRCPWGGLSSLDQTDPAFQPISTGQDNLSYHNGDSWFFINNLAALALLRFDSKLYRSTILELLDGSTTEILWKNMVGMPGEIASSSSGASWGCGIQAFSGGSYLLLAQEFRDQLLPQLRDSTN